MSPLEWRSWFLTLWTVARSIAIPASRQSPKTFWSNRVESARWARSLYWYTWYKYSRNGLRHTKLSVERVASLKNQSWLHQHRINSLVNFSRACLWRRTIINLCLGNLAKTKEKRNSWILQQILYQRKGWSYTIQRRVPQSQKPLQSTTERVD